jgi:hypothetical protein
MKTRSRLSVALAAAVLLVAAAPAPAQFRPPIFEPPIRLPFFEPPGRLPFVEPFRMPSFEPPTFRIPNFEPPTYRMPNFETPGFRMPSFEPPAVGFSGYVPPYTGIPGLPGGNIGIPGYDPFGSGGVVGRMGGGSILGQPGRGFGNLGIGGQRYNPNPLPPYARNANPEVTPAPRPANPALVQRSIEARLSSAPHEALRMLRQQGNVLSSETRLHIAERAANDVAARAGATKQPLDMLPQVRQAAGDAATINPDLGKHLEAVRGRLEALALQDGLDGVSRLLEEKNWVQAAGRAGDPRLRELVRALPKPAEAEHAFQEVADFRGPLESVDRLEKTLATTAGRPGEALSLWQGLPIETLPEKVREPARGLRALAELRALAAAPVAPGRDWPGARRAADVLAASSGDPALGRRVLQSFAAQEFLAGKTDEAQRLLPNDGPADNAAALLRDMKAILLGEGRVETWPATQALPPEAGGAGGGKRGPPPGLRLLMPEGSPEGWRPPQRESALDGLPPLGDAAPTEKALRDQAFAGVRGVREGTARHATEALHVIHLVRSQLHVPPAPKPPAANPAKPDDKGGPQDEEFVAAVERNLGHKLTPPERVTALRLKKDGLSPQAVASQLAPMGAVKD